MKYVEYQSRAEAEELQTASDVLHEAVKRGYYVNGKPAGTAVPGSFGWTMHQFPIEEHLDGDRWAHRSVDVDKDGKATGRKKLTKEQKDLLKEAKKAEKELGSGWGKSV